MVFKLPQFKDGKILSARELNDLAEVSLSLEYFRYNCVAGKQYGFFAPPIKEDHKVWNKFFMDRENLSITNLFLINKEGYPFLAQGENKIPITDHSSCLYAVANFTKNSKSNSGYEVKFEWAIDEWAIEPKQLFIKLGEVKESNGEKQFSLEPPAITLDSTSDLWEAAKKLKTVIQNEYIEELVNHSRESQVDRNELLNRCDQSILFSENTRVDTFIKEAQLLLESTRGFYYRLIDEENSHNYSSKNLTGRALESYLIKNQAQTKESEKILINNIEENFKKLEDCQSKNTASNQLLLVERLVKLFDSHSPIIQKLKNNENSHKSGLKGDLIPSYDRGKKIYRYQLPNENSSSEIVVEFFNNDPGSNDPGSKAFFALSDDGKFPGSFCPLDDDNSIKLDDTTYQYRLNYPLRRYLYLEVPNDIELIVNIN